MTQAATRVVIAGVSTRAAAESAALAGFDVTTFDAYADLDQHPSVRAHAVPRTTHGRFSPHRAATAARAHHADAAIYLSSFENHPMAVSMLGRERLLWGNTASVLARVRDPFDVADALVQRGFAAPAVARPEDSAHGRIDHDAHRGCDDRRASRGLRSPVREGDWMIKPRRSGGGRGVRGWRPGSRVPRNCYLQSRIDGVAGSIVFVADGRRAASLGLSRQLIGDPEFGAAGFQYCGSILGSADVLFQSAQSHSATRSSIGSHDVRARAQRLADAVTDEYGLIGVNGIDFIVSAGVPWPIEINPRWCSSMELVERAHGISVFGAHAHACAHRDLSTLDVAAISRSSLGGPEGPPLRPWSRSSRVVGKAVVFARHRLRVRDTGAWLGDRDIRDVPHSGDEIRAGQPICTVFAAADTPDACRAALVSRAQDIYRVVGGWRAEAA